MRILKKALPKISPARVLSVFLFIALISNIYLLKKISKLQSDYTPQTYAQRENPIPLTETPAVSPIPTSEDSTQLWACINLSQSCQPISRQACREQGIYCYTSLEQCNTRSDCGIDIPPATPTPPLTGDPGRPTPSSSCIIDFDNSGDFDIEDMQIFVNEARNNPACYSGGNGGGGERG